MSSTRAVPPAPIAEYTRGASHREVGYRPPGRANPRLHDATLPIRVLVADEQPLIREGVSALLSARHDFRVVGQARSESEIVRQLRQVTPDIVLSDVSMLGDSTLGMARGLNAVGSCLVCQAVVLAAAIETVDVITLLRRGVRGILSKQSATELIFKCLLAVHKGEVWISRSIETSIVEALSSGTDPALHRSPGEFRLTSREYEVLQLVAQGEANKRVAERLAVSEDTVKHHLTNIFDKTGASSRLELALFAVHHHLIGLA
jgi:two-component system, NarL family, nitrate/nitrite response regulator NarL